MSLYPEWLFEEFEMMDVDESVDQNLDMTNYEFDYKNQRTRTLSSGKTIRSSVHHAYLWWAWKCLNTERFRYPIYSSDFGVEIEAIIERDYEQSVAESEITRTISEALAVDGRTVEARNFEFNWGTDWVHVKFELESIYNTDIITVRREVANSG